jgi:hypothetical protein
MIYCFQLLLSKFNLRRYIKDYKTVTHAEFEASWRTNAMGQGPTLVHSSAQPEPFLTQNTP